MQMSASYKYFGTPPAPPMSPIFKVVLPHKKAIVQRILHPSVCTNLERFPLKKIDEQSDRMDRELAELFSGEFSVLLLYGFVFLLKKFLKVSPNTALNPTFTKVCVI